MNSCHKCRSPFDLETPSWCSCDVPLRTLRCASCGSCFCAAPMPYKRQFWADAPRELRIAGRSGLDRRSGGRIELAIRVGHQSLVAEGHGPASQASSPSICCSASRPRARRLVSVPIGTCMTCAASL